MTGEPATAICIDVELGGRSFCPDPQVSVGVERIFSEPLPFVPVAK